MTDLDDASNVEMAYSDVLVSGVAGQAQVRLWMTVGSAGNAGRGLVQLRTLKGAGQRCAVVQSRTGDFSIPGCA